jgi:hypothetical protein
MGRLILLCAMLACVSTAASAQSYHQGYTTRNGTYVAPHWQSTPDNSYNNNWSVRPNVNPYAGREGTLAPTWNDRPPSSGLGNSYPSPYGSSYDTSPYRRR